MRRGSNGSPRVLLIATQDNDTIQHLCRRLQLDLKYASTLTNALQDLHHSDSDVVLYDQDLSPQGWRMSVATLAEACPRSSIILLTRQPDLWNEVIRGGGHDLIRKPITESEAESTISLAVARAKLSHR